MALIGNRDDVDHEATTQPAPATMQGKLEAAMDAWVAAGNVMHWGRGEREAFVEFVAKRLESGA